ncbi:UDP-2,4-diacetamido-2,4,6-trideoxy-beta-L-altropyranose hydrolase [Clostridium sporogenes]
MKICIRTDGGCFIGLGHIIRTLALSKELRKNHEVFYVCRLSKNNPMKYLPGINLVKENGFNVIEIEEEKLIDEIVNIDADLIITDSYEADENYYNVLKERFNISGCLDDEKCCEYFNVDFLINQNPYGKDINYKVNDNTELLLGTKYIILRDKFLKNDIRVINEKMSKIMITVGGSDNNNITEAIIKELLVLNKELFIIVGPGFKYADKLKKYENGKVHLCFNVDIKYYMKLCDVAIASCGSTLYELASVGIPTLGIVVVDNQVLAAKTMEKLDIIKYSKIENLRNDLINLSYDKRKLMSSNGQKLIDGKGIERIVDVLERRFLR